MEFKIGLPPLETKSLRSTGLHISATRTHAAPPSPTDPNTAASAAGIGWDHAESLGTRDNQNNECDIPLLAPWAGKHGC